jgi:flavin-dependent dehydrogenase
MSHATLDLAIVGGGPAGISTALHLVHHAPALAGRVVVLEKERYPRDKICAGAIGGRGLRLLERLGVSIAVPFVPIHAISLAFHGGSCLLREPDLGIVVRRIEFDHALAREAERRGIEVREGEGVTGIEVGGDSVRVRLSSGGVCEARAAVGADGVGGVVRRSIGLSPAQLRAQVVELDTEPVASDPPRDALHFDFTRADLAGYLWDFPTLVDGERLVCRGVYRIARGGAAQRGHRDDLHGRLGQHLTAKGLDISRYRPKPYAERGFAADERLSAPRVLLVGEAAGIDIATGEGIAQAIQYGALAGRYLARAFQRSAFGFSDWLARVKSASLGWQLRQRLWVQERFYGRERDLMERLVLSAPSGVRLGMRQFAGKSFGAATVASTAAELFFGITRAPRRPSTRRPA